MGGGCRYKAQERVNDSFTSFFSKNHENQEDTIVNMNFGTKRKQSGFTLVEIAIVLVIVGLLIGGVLKGREMITNAKIKRIENDFAGVSAAIYAYQDRYGVLPGDDPAASTRFPGTWRSSDNGNGNGNISGGWNSTNNANESRKIWKHLRGAGLIAGPVDNTNASYQQPSNSFGGLVGIDLNVYNLSGHNIVFGEIPRDSRIEAMSPGISPNTML